MRFCATLQLPTALRLEGRVEARVSRVGPGGAGPADRQFRVRFKRFQWLAAPFPSCSRSGLRARAKSATALRAAEFWRSRWRAMGCKSVIAVEFAYDPDDPIDRVEVRSRDGIVHRAIGHEQRFVEPAHLKREELGRGLRHTLGEDLPNEIAHPLERKALARGDLGDRNAAIEEADDPRLTPGPVQPRRHGPVAASGCTG